MQSFSTVNIRRGRTRRLMYTFTPGFVFESNDPTNPLHGSLVGASDQSVVVYDGHKMIHALRSDLECK